MTTHITDAHRHAFQALTSGRYDNFALFSCHVDGSPAAAIVAVNERPPAEQGGESEYQVTPIFVSITEDMVLTDHDGREARPAHCRAPIRHPHPAAMP